MKGLIQTVCLFGILLSNIQMHAQCNCATTASLDWSQITWSDGDRSNNYDIVTSGAQTVNVDFNISTSASGTFSAYGANTPCEDGPGASSFFFNTGLDLGVIFDPASNQGQSPVFIDVVFDQPVSCMVFDISDIDISGTNRRDRVIVTGNSGAVTPTLSVVSSRPTVSVSANTASAIGGTSGANNDGSASEGTNNGNILVNFGTTEITSIRVNYREISGQSNPAGRGIGLFGTFNFCPPALLPVELISFDVDDNADDCSAQVSWKTAEEIDIDHYLVSYSKEGYDFTPLGIVHPLFTAGIKEYKFQTYEEREGYFLLSEVTLDGTINRLSLSKFNPNCQGSESSMVYPNPATGGQVKWRINSLSSYDEIQLDIYDAFGNHIPLLPGSNYVDRELNLPLSDLPNGNYVIRAQFNGRVYNEIITLLQ